MMTFLCTSLVVLVCYALHSFLKGPHQWYGIELGNERCTVNAPLLGIWHPRIEVVEGAGRDADDLVPEWCVREELAATYRAEDSPRTSVSMAT